MEFLAYNLKVAVLLAVFYMFYRLLLSRETFHRVNRVVLLTTAVASFVLPLVVITVHKTVVVNGNAATVGLGPLTAAVEEPSSPLWQTALVALFFAGMAVTLGHTLTSVLRVWMLIRSSERHPQADGCVICVAQRDLSPFSWMHFIVFSRNDYNNLPVEGSGVASILAHERGHISQHHSLDLLLVDTLTALQWFNPAVWMLRQDLRAIHEYEADQAVLSQGINMRQYQYLLIQKAVSRCGYSVANGISHSTLKNRIDMMINNKKSSRRSLLKLLALVPIVGIALALQAETVTDYVYSQPQKKVVDTGDYEKVFDVVEQMPEFPGGMEGMMKFLVENVRYPEAAHKAQTEGRVLVQFIVETDGTVSNTKVVEKVNDDLDGEAIRVVGSMPKWKPGRQNGKPVRVKYTLPVTFRLK